MGTGELTLAMRVKLIVAGLVALGTLTNLGACSSDDGDAITPVAPDTRPPTPPDWDRAITRPDEATAAAGRDACKFARGAMPDETLGSGVPTGKDYARRGFVGHGVYDHASILRFIQAKHRLPALSARDANALVPTEFFDFQSPPDLALPALPEATIDPAEKAYCDQTFAR
jgi:phospholipase C